ncbi:MAG: Gfo/Idh/MocA family oxidoreductase [Paenibacillaceae bacterium]|nr:Gfo/Idh/MocA family oxidoreductase [Paenibacillaceae bacterium]
MRFGIIGTNWITDEFLKAAAEHGEFRLTAVYSRTEEKGRAFAARYGDPAVFTDLGDMLGSGLVDAVYIASPNALHAAQAIACMERGKHVLCEKPAASNVREFDAMTAAARANGVVLMEAVKSTLMPTFAAIREQLPALGPLRRVFANVSKYSSRYDAYKQGNVLNAFDPSLSNGSLMDLGIYCLYPLVALFGPPQRVSANAYMLASGVDGEGSLLLSYPEMEAIVAHSKITDSYAPSEFQGELATLVVDHINKPERAVVHYRDGRTEDITPPLPNRPMYYELAEFISLCAGGRFESTVNTHAVSRATLAVMDEARRQIGLTFPADRPAED